MATRPLPGPPAARAAALRAKARARLHSAKARVRHVREDPVPPDDQSTDGNYT